MSQSAPPTAEHRLGWWGQALLLVALWLSLVKLPGAPLVSLDNSWQMVLGYAAERSLQHGVDIVFTYGPLGYLLTSTYMGSHFGAFLTWQLAGNFLIACALYRFARELPGWRRVVFYGYLFLYASIYADAMQMNFIAIFSLLLMRPGFRRPLWLVAVGAAFAIFALMKFTNLLLCLFSLGVLVAWFGFSRARREAVWLAGTFSLVFLGLWLAHGQRLAALPDFFRYGLQVSLGYVEAMAVYESPVMLALGLGALGAIVAYAALYLWGQADRRAAFATCLLLGAVVFINWKHGFVRADGHVLAHFVMGLLVVCSYPALTDDNRSRGRAKGVALLTAAGCCLTGIGMVSLPAVTQAPGGWNERVHQVGSALLNPAAFRRSLDSALQQLSVRIDQPNLRRIVGDETVDHLGGDQVYTLVNRFNYTPRPAIQGYTTYTDGLNRLDEAFYRSERGPRFAIQRFRTIDGRFPTLDDSLTLRLLLQDYEFIMEEGGLLLWERPATLTPPATATTGVLLRQTVRFGEKVTVPDSGGRPVWAVIRVRNNLPGAVRKFFYKPPLLYLEPTDQAGATERLQLVRAMAATGFILSPWFSTGEDLIAFQHARFSRRVAEFTVRTMPGGERWFADDIEVELHALAPFKQSMVDVNQRLKNRFRMMNRKPVAVEADVPMASLLLDDREVLMLHAESRMDFDLTTPTRSVNGRFGILPGAYQNGNDTDGVEFVIEFVLPSGERRVLLQRFLDPRQRPEDRPSQAFKVDVPTASGGKLVFRTLPGPAGRSSYDWSYWTDLVFD